MRKYTKLNFIIISILCLICSCCKGGDVIKNKISPSNKNILELVTTVYDEQQLFKIAAYSGTIYELNLSYPIECLRRESDFYKAEYMGNKKVAIVVFDKNGNKLNGNIFDVFLNSSDFDSLSIGKTLNDATELDPNGNYLFLYTGRSDVPRISTHYTSDGFEIRIEYDMMNIITSISKKMI